MKTSKLTQYITLAIVLMFVTQTFGFAADKKEKCYDEKNTSIEVKKNKMFTIKLENASSTEYTWELVQPIDKTKIKLQKKEFKKDKNCCKKGDAECKDKKNHKEDADKKVKMDKKDKTMKCVSGTQVFKFKAKAKGETTIKVKYVKKADKTDQKTIEYKVKID